MISECDLSIQDLSRVELDSRFGLPRFNVALELGADPGLRLGGLRSQRHRTTLIFEGEAHQSDKTLSDISGMDVVAHANDPREIIRHVRDWLNTNREPGARVLPGAAAINEDYNLYRQFAPGIIAELRFDPHDELPHNDYRHVVEIALPMIEAYRGLL